MTSTAVRVGLRVRPLTQKEQLSNCTECISFIPDEPQILIGTDKSFTFDYVYDANTPQVQVYSSSAKPLIEKFLDGFNATILAYGQTGSGKTYSMGTSLENSANAEQEGIVPRCIVQLYRSLQERTESIPGFEYEVYVSFLELYNEELIDLLNPYQAQKRKGVNATVPPAEITIREDVAGNIYWSGVKEELCSSPEELLGFLAKGSLCRTTGSTDMNTVSSRSHAVFSVILKQTRPDLEDTNSLTSKFHFVDLAGSERLKRTNAQGDRAKEGIAINSGLLALGNVISALGDEHRRGSHVPYRDSKLTRLLQDSLGGNSQTLMLACVSPADANFMETLNTLKYANRARNIKNRVVINQDFAGSSIEVNQLRAQVARLRMEVASLRSEGATGNSRNVASSYMSMDENRALRNEVIRLRDRIQELSTNLIQVTSERDTMVMEQELGEFLKYEEQLDAQVPSSRRPSYDYNNYNTNNNDSQQSILEPMSANARIKAHPLVAQYQKTIQDLTNELADTKDRLVFLESTKPPTSSTAAYQSTQLSLSSSTLSFSQSTSHPNGRLRKPTTHRRRRRPLMSSSSSTTTSGRRGIRSRRLHTSFSGRTQHITYTEQGDAESDSESHDEDIRNGVKDSIAKAREEIQKGMQVLELIKPLEDTAEEWEKELQAFEEAESKLYDDKRIISDEGNFTSSPSPDGQRSDSSFFDEIEGLAVPSWEDDLKLSKSSIGSKSNVSSQDDSSALSSTKVKQDDNAAASHSDKYNPQLVRMLHQIQSDIRVKEELVSHLEKSETEYSFMRRKFDDKIGDLESKLANLQREKDEALARTKSGFASSNIMNNTKSDGTQLREKQQLIEIRHAYENKMKSLLSEIQDLRRKYSQTTMTMQATRNQNDTLLRSLRVNVETLKMEKKRMIKRMKQEAERVREQMTLQDRKIHQLQRLNAEANQARRRLEREHEAQKLTLKRRNEEVLMNNNQLKQLTNVLKKAVREGGVLDERLLAKVSKAMGGSFAIMARGGGLAFRTSSSSSSTTSNIGGGRRRKNPIPVHVRATRKKQLLDRALYQLIQGKQAIVEMEQLLFKRERLAAEKLELAEERKQIYLAEKENAELTGQPMNSMGVEFMDERIDMISAEISYLSARIRALQSEAAGEMMDESATASMDGSVASSSKQQSQPEKRVTFADEIISDSAAAALASSHDEWMDMDAMEEQFNVPAAAAPEVAYDMTLKILKSLEVDECRRIAEGLVDDIVNVRTSECNRQVTMQNLERTVHDLRRTLIVMKRAAIATTVDNERRIRKLEGGAFGSDDEKDSAIDVKIEEYINNGNTIFDKIYEDGLRGMITTPEPGSTEYYHITNSANGSPVGSSLGGGSSVEEAVLLSPLMSPASTTGSTTNSTGPTRPELLSSSNNHNIPINAVKPPTSLTEKGKYINRDTTPSPDRFFNMIQKRMSWQQQQQRSDSPMAISMINPAEFARYTTNDRESSTSSIRSSHLRRSSIQSDQSSSQPESSNSSQGGSVTLRKRAFSLQQPPVPTRRRASLRELSLMGSTTTVSTSPRHLHTGSMADQIVPTYYHQQPQPPFYHHQQQQAQYYHNKDLPASPRVSASVIHQQHHHHQQQRVATLRRPSSVSTFAPQSSMMMNASVTMERGSSAGSNSSGNNVFDRLSQTPTRASSAKMQYRHSISSMDDLQQRFESSNRSSSAMSGAFYN